MTKKTNHSIEIEPLRTNLYEVAEQYGWRSPQALEASRALDIPVTMEQGRLWLYGQAENVPGQVQTI